MHKIVEDAPPKLEIPHTPHLADFLSRCLQKDPRRRPRADQLLRHPWITTEKLPIPPNAVVPKTVSLVDLCMTAQEHDDDEDSDEEDDSESESDEPVNESAPSGVNVATQSDNQSEEEEEYTDEEDSMTEEQREIQSFHRQFDELILWLNRALDQQNKKQATRLCETIQGRDKPLRMKYGDHPDAKPLIDSLNQVLTRYYKVERISLFFLLFFLLILFCVLQEVEGAVGQINFNKIEKEDRDDSGTESSEYDSEEEEEESEEENAPSMDMFGASNFLRGI